MSLLNVFGISNLALHDLGLDQAGPPPPHWFDWVAGLNGALGRRITLFASATEPLSAGAWVEAAESLGIQPCVVLSKRDRLNDWLAMDGVRVQVVEPASSAMTRQLIATLTLPDTSLLEAWTVSRVGGMRGMSVLLASIPYPLRAAYGREVARWCSLPAVHAMLADTEFADLLWWPVPDLSSGTTLLSTSDFEGLDIAEPGARELRFELKSCVGTGIGLDARGESLAYGLLGLCASTFFARNVHVERRLAVIALGEPKAKVHQSDEALPSLPARSTTARGSRYASGLAAMSGETAAELQPTQHETAVARVGQDSGSRIADRSTRTQGVPRSAPYATRVVQDRRELEFWVSQHGEAFDLRLRNEAENTWRCRASLLFGGDVVQTADGRRIVDAEDIRRVKLALQQGVEGPQAPAWRFFSRLGLREEWLDDQVLGFAANLLRAHPNPSDWNQCAGFHTPKMHAQLLGLISGLAARANALPTMGFGTLAQLASIPVAHCQFAADGPRLLDRVERAAKRWRSLRHAEADVSIVGLYASATALLTAPGGTPFSTFLRWASLTPATLTEWSWREWQEARKTLLTNESLLRECDRLLVDANDSARPLAGRADALEDIYRRVSDACGWGMKPVDPHLHWVRLMKQVMSRLFAWPLLVGTGRDDRLMAGLSLPLGLRINSRGNRPGVQVLPLDGQAAECSAGIWTFRDDASALAWDDEWHQSLESGWAAAKALWASQNARAHVNSEWQLDVDMCTAYEIVKRAIGGVQGGYKLRGRSLQACVAQSSLALLVPSVRLPAAAITGAAKQESDESSLDEPDGVELKLDFALHSGLFDRVCLPKTRNCVDTVSRWRVRNPGGVEINFFADLREAADIVHAGSWRRVRFSRAPEAEDSFCRNLQQAQDDVFGSAWECEAITAAFSNQDCAVTHVDVGEERWCDNFEGHLGTWLAHFDHKIRRGDWTRDSVDHNRTGRRGASGNRGGLGAVVARLAPGDHEVRLCAALLESLGATHEQSVRIPWLNAGAAAELLAQLLLPGRSRPRRQSLPAVDLLVLIDEAGISRKRMCVSGDPSSGLLFDLLHPEGGAFAALNSRLLEQGLGLSLFGRTRIVVLHPPSVDFDDRFAATSPRPLVPALIRALSVFRYGFTVHQAVALQSYLRRVNKGPGAARWSPNEWVKVLGTLNDLCTGGEYAWLKQRRDSYFLTQRARAETKEAAEERDPAFHFAAALSFAPMLATRNGLSGINRDRAFEHEATFEALWHMRQAYELSRASAGPRWKAFRREVGEAIAQLLLSSPRPYWDSMEASMRLLPNDVRGDCGFHLARELLDEEASVAKRHPAPRHYALAIQSAARVLRLPNLSEDPRGKALAQGKAWYRQSTDAGSSSRLIVDSEYAYLLRSAGAKWGDPELGDVEQRVVDACAKLSTDWDDAAPGEISSGWFISFVHDEQVPIEQRCLVASGMCWTTGGNRDAFWITFFGLADGIDLVAPSPVGTGPAGDWIVKHLTRWAQAFPPEERTGFKRRLVALGSLPIAELAHSASTALCKWLESSTALQDSRGVAEELRRIAQEVAAAPSW